MATEEQYEFARKYWFHNLGAFSGLRIPNAVANASRAANNVDATMRKRDPLAMKRADSAVHEVDGKLNRVYLGHAAIFPGSK